jgi:MFS family permease
MFQALTNSPKRVISQTVWVLSLVSMFTDVASEMLYPVMPIFLRQIGFSIVLIGILEGLAEAVAGLSKSYFGKQSDFIGKRLPFIQIGYILSAISKPMMGIFIFPLWIFLARTIDRIGKGVRTGARDAMLSDEATPATKARVFGFHRSLDTLGAVMGPAIALVYLYFYPSHYRQLFFVAFVPGILAMAATFLIKEKRPPTKSEKVTSPHFFAFAGYWKNSPLLYKKLLIGLLFFALFNSADVFLLLQMKANGLSDTAVIGMYIFYNMVYALSSYPLGVLADRLGLKKVFLAGLCTCAIVYAGFSFHQPIHIYGILLALYGLYAAATEGIAKAWISNLVDKTDTATAIGTYSGFQSIAALLASSIAGIIWYNVGASATFLCTSIATIIVVFYISRIKF